MQLPGTVDSSAIYLKGVTVHGTSHDTLFVTTTYGITLAIDVHSGSILWQWKPSSYASLAGTAQITTATPVADPSRKWIYAASPDGKIQKLSVAKGHAAWRLSITKDADAREDRVRAQLRERPRDRHDRRVHRRRAAVPGARRGHLAGREASRRVELALLEPARAYRPVELPAERLRDLGARRRGRHAREREPPRRDGERHVGRADVLGRRGDRALLRRRRCSATTRRRTRPS